MTTLTVLELFAGAVGGWSLGLHRAGFRTVAACEIDPWRRAVFAANNPGVVMYSDVRDLTADRLRADLGYLPDIVVGSPPCQEISAANTAGRGIDDDHLFWEWVRLVGEIRPRWAAAENSPNARTTGIDGILDALEAGGYATWPMVVGADHAGANHKRRRLWLIAANADGCLVMGAGTHGDDPDADRHGQHGRASHGEMDWGLDGVARNPDSPRHPIGPGIRRDDGAQLPPALRAIGLAWPAWNGGLSGLAASCAASGFGGLDDGSSAGLAPAARNRCVAAYGDAIVPQISEAIGRAMLAVIL